MRQKLLEAPGVPERINQETVPVMINTTNDGFPKDVKCLKWFRDQHKENPWIHMIYGFSIFINHDGSRYFGSSGCQCKNHTRRGTPYINAVQVFSNSLDRWKRVRRLERLEKRSKEEEAQLQKTYKDGEKQVAEGQVCGNDMRLMTARFLSGWGAESWKNVLAQLILPKPGQNENDPLGRRMRVAATRRLGEFILDDSPFDGRHTEHLAAIYTDVAATEYDEVRRKIMKQKKLRYVRPEDIPLPPSLIRLAAVSLGKIVEKNWKASDPLLVKKARKWWAAHEKDPQFQLSALKPRR